MINVTSMLPFITPLFVKKLSIFKDNYVAFLFVIVLYVGSIHKLNGQIVQIAESNQNNQLSSTKGLIEVSQNNEIKRAQLVLAIRLQPYIRVFSSSPKTINSPGSKSSGSTSPPIFSRCRLTTWFPTAANMRRTW